MKTLYKLYLVLVAIPLFYFTDIVCAQNGCVCELESSETRSTPAFETIVKYIPDDFTEIKYVKVNFHFMLKSDSTLNFRPFDDGLGNCSFTAFDYSEQLITYANQQLRTNERMHLPQGNNTTVLPRKYQLVLKDVYFHYDDNAYTFANLSLGEIGNYSANPESEINIFFVYDDEQSGYVGGGNANMYGNRYVRVQAAWQKYRDGGLLSL